MAKTIVGNNKNPTNWFVEHEVEYEDDDGDTYTDFEPGEDVDEDTIIGYRFICPKNSYSNTVTLGFWYRRPTSNWYWNECYGSECEPVFPVVYSCDDSWNLKECLNTNIKAVELENSPNGWIVQNITLKRKLQKNEKIYFGVYGVLFPTNWNNESVQLGDCYYYWSRKNLYFWSLTSDQIISLLFSDNFYGSNTGNMKRDTNACVYLEYENEVESVSYTRTVTAKYIPETTVIKKGNFMRKANSYIRNSELVSRFRIVTCSLYSEAKAYSSVSKLRFLYRLINENENFIDDVKRCLKINTLIVDKKEFSDELIRNLIIGRCITAGILPSDFLERTADYKRINNTKPEVKSITERKTKTFRNTVDSVLFSVFVIPSRIFYRTVQMIVSFWDWLKGKIRETNNIVSFFCPVDLEIKLECKV